MAFVHNNSVGVGSRVRLTRQFASLAGYFETGTIVTITEEGDRGYSFVDDEGNRMTECGWSGFEPVGELHG